MVTHVDAGGQRGVALIVTLLGVGLMTVLGLGLVLSAAAERLAGANHDDSVRLLNVAESALEITARRLGSLDDWSLALDGRVQSELVDGAPVGARHPLPGLVIDLTNLTNLASCGRAAACDDLQVAAPTADRPWGLNNPRWRAFLHAPLAALDDPLHRPPAYAVVLVGDDEEETDGDVTADGGGPDGEGRYIIRARAYAFAPTGGRRVIEARLARICTRVDGDEVCRPGSRVQSWWQLVGGPL